MSVELVRVDFRLIHGQVITRWVPQLSINEVVIIDTDLSNDEFMKQVFHMAIPQNVNLRILNIKEAVKSQKNDEYEKNRVLLLFKNINELVKAVDEGLILDEVQIGGLGGGPGRKAVSNAITLDQEDANKLLSLEKEGIEIYFQTTPDYPLESLEKVLKRM